MSEEFENIIDVAGEPVQEQPSGKMPWVNENL
jgi:hypothetical protein